MLAAWGGVEGHKVNDENEPRPTGRLISRGYTEAPAGTVVVAGNPAGGWVLIELRIKDGQMVKRDEIVAVLSNYPQAEVALRTAEAKLEAGL